MPHEGGGYVSSTLPRSSCHCQRRCAAGRRCFTGYKWLVPVPSGGFYPECYYVESAIVAVADNKAFSHARYSNGGTCNLALSRPPGYLGAEVQGWYDPNNDGTYSYCGTTGIYTNSSSTSSFGVGAILCPNPAGLDPYFSRSRASHYDAGLGVYYVSSLRDSPIQNY